MGNNTSTHRARRHGLSTATVASTETGASGGSSGSGKDRWRLRGFGHSSRTGSPAGADRIAADGGAGQAGIGAGAGRDPGVQGAKPMLAPDVAAVPLTEHSNSSSNTHHPSSAARAPSEQQQLPMSTPQTVPCQVCVVVSILAV